LIKRVRIGKETDNRNFSGLFILVSQLGYRAWFTAKDRLDTFLIMYSEFIGLAFLYLSCCDWWKQLVQSSVPLILP